MKVGDLMTLNQLIMAKEELNLTCADISEGSGVPVSTVRKIFSEGTKKPRRQTMEALSDYIESMYVPEQIQFFREEAYRTGGTEYGRGLPAVWKHPSLTSEVREMPVYSREAEKPVSVHSIDDFDAMPSFPRVELIDGEVFVMESPLLKHQDTVMLFAVQVSSFIKKNKGTCHPLFSPVAVQPVASDEKTILQPDFLVVCDPEKLSDGRHIIGGPDWVVEVLSPSTRQKDMVKKKPKYQSGGVKELWFVDLEAYIVIIYDFTKPDVSYVKSMNDPIPVGIYDGKLKIDLSELMEE